MSARAKRETRVIAYRKWRGRAAGGAGGLPLVAPEEYGAPPDDETDAGWRAVRIGPLPPLVALPMPLPLPLPLPLAPLLTVTT